MEPRGRGRASKGGRARGEPSQQFVSRPGPQGGAPPPQGAWGRPQGPPPGQQMRHPQPQPAQQPQGAWGRPQGGQQQPQKPQLQGRGSRIGDDAGGSRRAMEVQLPGVTGAAGGQPSRDRGGGNGGVRGRMNRNEIIHTKPAHVQSKAGTSGTTIQLAANFFKIINKPDWCLHQYRVNFDPEIDDTRTKRKLIYVAYKQENDIGGFLFDGTVLYTPLILNPDPMERFADKDDVKVRITVKRVGELSWGDYHYLQVFNILIRKCLRLMELQLVGREYYDCNAQINIPDHRLCLWPGYHTSIRQYETSIMMNTELTFKVMRSDNVYDLLLNTVDRSGRSDMAAFQKKVIGSIVLTFYNNKTYRIDDIDFKTTPASTFPLNSGGQISYLEYYKKRYNINIQVPTQPMLVSRLKPREIGAGQKETLYLVPELCQLTGLTDDQRANFHLMSALAQHTRIGPAGRQGKLQEFVRKLTSKAEIMQEVRRWNLDVAKKLVEFPGRVLPPELIRAGQDVTFSAGNKADWTMSLRSNPMCVSARMDRMAVITPQNLSHPTEEFLKTLSKAASGMKWNIGNHKIFPIENDRSAAYLNKLEEVIGMNPTLIMCVLPTKTADRYNAIKKKCCVDRGVPSQVVVARNFRNKNVMSIATKIAIQLNCKIGGAPWTVHIPTKTLMVVGYDVCRDTANRGKSFGGMVASLNQSCTRYFSSVSEHQMEEELSNNFGSFMLLACQKYREVNGEFPRQICIFRDGVGEGQIPHVKDHEIKNIRDKLTSQIYTGDIPLKMAVVVVSKRINTRIFQGDNNPPPGTVVDNTITLPERYDYFIVSQCVNQGTVTPTSFNVIDDNMGLSPDNMQKLTYKMCHLYYNWSGTVRVPAPCQYAHKLAFLTAQSLHRPADRKLENLLYYL
ncbi:hypothetical protein HHI36_002551 [Cryptolaemus montrouzieri]|uniref:Piwi n=1 Tax=Cryptolaemus montrouzieri TaxID=559131 RepID=A0ABD2PBE9_9CUCU